MSRILVIEASATLRHALQKLLSTSAFDVCIAPTFETGLSLLNDAIAGRTAFDAVVIGWPIRTDTGADEVLALLEHKDLLSVRVLIFTHEADPAKLNWITRRQHTAMLLWSDYEECGEAVAKLLESHSDHKSVSANELVGDDPIRVLFVDDSPTVRVNFRKLLIANGYDCDVAASVTEGMDTARRGKYDIAIVDYFMPDATGDELVRQLSAHPITKDITCAVITGTYSDSVIRDCLDAGAVECMFKSEAKELFLARVRSLSRGIRDRKSMENERRRLEGILTSVGDGVYGVDNQGRITFMNPTARDMVGIFDDSDVIGDTPHDLFHYAFEDGTLIPIDNCFLTGCYQRGAKISGWQTVFWHSTGNCIPVECTVYPLNIEGKREGSVVAFRDVSDRKLLEEELRWQATHDSLTKLLNRRYLETQLQQELQRLKRTDQKSAILFIDMDRFKYINDTATHAAGDHLLIDVGQKLQGRLRATDTLARVGGDEFGVILRQVDEEDLTAIADSFREVIANERFYYAGKEYHVTASVGAAVLDANVTSTGECMSQADIACNLAKKAGRNKTHIFHSDDQANAHMDAELGWAATLRDALENDKFELVFQPILGLNRIDFNALPADQGMIWEQYCGEDERPRCHYETLLRLRSHDHTLVTPDAFLPTAERFNLMSAIDRWVVDRAFALVAVEKETGRKISLSINLSAYSLMDTEFADYVREKLEHYQLSGTVFTFEITETTAVTNIDEAQRLIAALRSLGCRFALDDFGSGFSSFGHLKFLNTDYIKIDGLFVQGMVADPIDRAVIMAVTEIAHSLNKRTVAEYVDSPEILRELKKCGVDYVQGFYVAKPQAVLPSDMAAALLAAETRDEAS